MLLVSGVLAAVAFGSTLGNSLVWDDSLLIERNQALVSFGELIGAWSKPFWASAGDLQTMTGAVYYRPVVHTLLFVVHALVGSKPWAYHLLVVLGHIAATVLTAKLALNLFTRWESALVAGCLFAVHPIHTESVAWVSGLSDVFMTLFAIGALVVSTGPEAATRWSARRSVVLVLLLLAACLTKEPGVLACVGVLIIGGPNWRARALAVGISMASFIGLRAFALRGVEAPFTHLELGPRGWVLHGFSLFGQGVSALLAPVGLNAYHLMPTLEHFTDARVLGGVMLLITLVGAAVWAWKTPFRLPMSMVLISLLPGTLVPRLGLNAFAERYLYFPSVWLVVGLAGATAVVLISWPTRRTVLLAAIGVLTLVGAQATLNRNEVWFSNLTLFADIAEQSPEAPMLVENLSQALIEAGRPNEALEILGTRPVQSLKVTEQLNLGIAQAATKHLPEAAATFHQALERIGSKESTRFTEGMLLTNLCLVEQNLGQLAQSLDTCKRAVSRVPFIAQTAAINARGLMQAGRLDEARAEAQRAFALDPANGPAKTMRQRLQ